MIALDFHLKKHQLFKAKHTKLSSLSVFRDHMIFGDTEQLQAGISVAPT